MDTQVFARTCELSVAFQCSTTAFGKKYDHYGNYVVAQNPDFPSIPLLGALCPPQDAKEKISTIVKSFLKDCRFQSFSCLCDGIQCFDGDFLAYKLTVTDKVWERMNDIVNTLGKGNFLCTCMERNALCIPIIFDLPPDEVGRKKMVDAAKLWLESAHAKTPSSITADHVLFRIRNIKTGTIIHANTIAMAC